MHRRICVLGICWAILAFIVQPVSAETLRVFAAVSLKEVFEEIATRYEKTATAVKVELHFAGSQVLRTQIEQGAPADVFASADMPHMIALKDRKRVTAYEVFAQNALVVVAPRDNTVVTRLQDLVRPKVRLVVAGPAVPVGRYTQQVLTRMTQSGRYGDDFKTRVMANVVSQETNVRAVLAKIALGEADAGFVYTTDAATVAEKVRLLPIPKQENAPAVYPIALLNDSPRKAQGRAFVAFIMGKEGQDILLKHGFSPPPPKEEASKKNSPASANKPTR